MLDVEHLSRTKVFVDDIDTRNAVVTRTTFWREVAIRQAAFCMRTSHLCGCKLSAARDYDV